LQFLLGAYVAAAPFKSDPTIIAGNSEKGKLLLAGKNRFAGCDRLSRRDREEPPSATTSWIAASTPSAPHACA